MDPKLLPTVQKAVSFGEHKHAYHPGEGVFPHLWESMHLPDHPQSKTATIGIQLFLSADARPHHKPSAVDFIFYGGGTATFLPHSEEASHTAYSLKILEE